MSNPRTVNSTVDNGRIKRVTTYSPIELDNISITEFQKAGTRTAQIRQVVHTVSTYPTKQVSTNMQQNIFDSEDFGFDGQDFDNTETRVAWIPVPEATTEEEFKAKLAAVNAMGATIYRVMSNQPILDDSQKYAVKSGLNGITLDTFANRQVTRFPKGHPQEGQICLDANNKVQYRRTFFWKTPLEDQDLRSADPADVYLSAELTLELNMTSPASGVDVANVLEGQTL